MHKTNLQQWKYVGYISNLFHMAREQLMMRKSRKTIGVWWETQGVKQELSKEKPSTKIFCIDQREKGKKNFFIFAQEQFAEQLKSFRAGKSI